eukprot:1855096-Amphidinium_carterae.1
MPLPALREKCQSQHVAFDEGMENNASLLAWALAEAVYHTTLASQQPDTARVGYSAAPMARREGFPSRRPGARLPQAQRAAQQLARP